MNNKIVIIHLGLKYLLRLSEHWITHNVKRKIESINQRVFRIGDLVESLEVLRE